MPRRPKMRPVTLKSKTMTEFTKRDTQRFDVLKIMQRAAKMKRGLTQTTKVS